MKKDLSTFAPSKKRKNSLITNLPYERLRKNHLRREHREQK